MANWGQKVVDNWAGMCYNTIMLGKRHERMANLDQKVVDNWTRVCYNTNMLVTRHATIDVQH